MNHDHVMSLSLPNSFMLLPQCVPSEVPASSSSCPLAKTIIMSVGGEAEPSAPDSPARRQGVVIVNTAMADPMGLGGGEGRGVGMGSGE